MGWLNSLRKKISSDKRQENFNPKVILLCNLKPAKMRGIESQAMVLCASSMDGTLVELVQPPASSRPGEIVRFEGFEGVPEKQLNSKKKVWEGIQVNLWTNDQKVATFVSPDDKSSHQLLCCGEMCTVKSIINGSIK